MHLMLRTVFFDKTKTLAIFMLFQLKQPYPQIVKMTQPTALIFKTFIVLILIHSIA